MILQAAKRIANIRLPDQTIVSMNSSVHKRGTGLLPDSRMEVLCTLKTVWRLHR